MTENAHYDEKLASVYDRMYPIAADTALAVEFLSALTPPDGRILELGVGTGRIACPLAACGFQVHGIDGSAAMLKQLARRDPDKRITTTLGDFTKEGTGLRFDLVAVLLNTFYVAITREDQIGCLTRVREQLAPEGRFVVEAFDPAPFHGMTKPELSLRHLDEKTIMLDNITVDRAHQLMVGTHTILDGGAPITTRHVLRYVFPHELDLLAELAGLRLVERWAGWSGEPYSHTSDRYVSVFAAS